MPDHFDLMIPGATTEEPRLEVTCPFDDSLIATVDVASKPAIEQALQTAADLFQDREHWLPKPERIGILQRTAELLAERRDELALGAAAEGGKPLADSLVEADRAIEGVKCCVETLRTQAGKEIPMNVNASSKGRFAVTFHEPIGPVLAFSAFNHPLNLIVHQAAPAIATGCPVIVKPAEATPLSCFRFVEIVREAGLPDEWCQALLSPNHGLSGKMVADKRIGFFTFIGSGKVGWMLRSKLAPGTRCALEHGGVAPVIMAADANLDDAIPLLGKGGFYHAGQVCVSVQRVYAHSSVARKVAKKLSDYARKLAVGDPRIMESEVGPLIRPEEVVRVGQWVEEAVQGGAELLCGGTPLSETTFAPTVLFDPPDNVRLSQQEIFGPVVSIYSYDKIGDAISRANSLPFSFQASVFTKNLDTALEVSHKVHAATMMVNDHTAFRVDWMPFAGRRESGLGVGGVPDTMAEMQYEKLIVVRSNQAVG